MRKIWAILLMVMISMALLIPTAFAAEYSYVCPKTYAISGTQTSIIELEQAFYDGATEYDETVTKNWMPNNSASAEYYYYTGWQGDGSKRTYTIPISVEETVLYNIEFVASQHVGGLSHLAVYVDDKLVIKNTKYTGTTAYGDLSKFTANDILVTEDTKAIKVVITAEGDSQANRHAYSVDCVRFLPVCNMENGAVVIEKSSWADRLDTNITTGYAGFGVNDYITYLVDVPVNGEYEIIVNAGTTGGFTLAATINGQTISKAIASTSTADKVGWDVPVNNTYSSFILSKGEHILTLKGTSSGSIYVRKITLKSVGGVKELNQPTVTYDNNTVILTFDKEIVSDAANISKVTASGGTGTASVTLDENDAKKIIIRNKTGKFKVKLASGLRNTEGEVQLLDYLFDCYFPSCSLTKAFFWESDTKYYAEIIFDVPVGSPSVQAWYVLYDDQDNVVGYVGNSNYGLWDGRQLDIGFDKAQYAGKFSKAKIFVWEKDMTPILLDPVVKEY